MVDFLLFLAFRARLHRRQVSHEGFDLVLREAYATQLLRVAVSVLLSDVRCLVQVSQPVCK